MLTDPGEIASPPVIEKLISKVKELAEAHPNNVYNPTNGPNGQCYYDQGNCANGMVGCIFGTALRALGYKPTGNATIKDELEVLGIDFDWNQGQWCKEFQTNQDLGDPWGKCL